MPYNNDVKLEGKVSDSRDDINFLSPNNFQIVIDNQSFKNVQLYVQKVSIPDMSLPKADLNGAMRNIGMAGDKMEYAPLDITFLIDEDLDNYREIHDWMIGQLSIEDKGTLSAKTRDITLIINTSHNNSTKEITFVDAYPVSLSSVPFESDISDVEYMVATASFEYSYYKFV
jgi:hypothetical protein